MMLGRRSFVLKMVPFSGAMFFLFFGGGGVCYFAENVSPTPKQRSLLKIYGNNSYYMVISGTFNYLGNI